MLKRLDNNCPVFMEPQSPITSTRSSVLLSRVLNILLNVAIQISKKFLFIDPRRKAFICVALVILLSMVKSLTNLNDGYYLVQKTSVFNQYGVKLGWMWTCLVVGPFIWFSSRAHYRDKDKTVIDVLRLAIATLCWYLSVRLFERVMRWTSRCDIGIFYSKAQCTEQGGVWIRGFDFSGHCFLMIYSMLVMAEEAHAFREWEQILQRDYNFGLAIRMRQEKRTKYVQYCAIAMLVLNIIWIGQLAISALYYHTFLDKVGGTIVAVFCWFLTYHKLYPAGFLQSPIQRVGDKGDAIR